MTPSNQSPKMKGVLQSYFKVSLKIWSSCQVGESSDEQKIEKVKFGTSSRKLGKSSSSVQELFFFFNIFRKISRKSSNFLF